MNETTSRLTARTAVQALTEKKGEDIRVIDISGISVLADYFVIASGSNVNQVRALAEAVEEELYKNGHLPKQKEGKADGGWILMDYADVIIHIFDRENRLFYDLERIWRDGREISPDEI